MAEPNRVMIALTSIFTGVGAGGAVTGAANWVAWQGWSILSVLGDPANTVFLSWAIGAGLSGYLCWRQSPAIAETWRRAAMAVTAGMGAIGAGGLAHLVGMESQMTASWVGTVMLPAYVLLLVAVAVFAWWMNQKYRSAVA